MPFTIHTIASKSKTFNCYKKARLFEAFCIGMRIDYSLIYPNGDIKDVEFKEKQMAELEEKIDKLKKQMKFLSQDKNVSDKDRNELRQYYENKLNAYTNRKKTLIENIHVTAKVLNTEAKQDRETP